MKLLCECGHPNHVHFAGTGPCHSPVMEVLEPARTEMEPPKVLFTRCHCERFVLKDSEQRADLV